MLEKQSPYLAHPSRLADLVAAIQALGSYRYAAREESKWKELLKEPKSAGSWTEIFREHPEFFRASSNDAGMHQLVLRRAQSAMHHAQSGTPISVQDFLALDAATRTNYSRSPLSNEQIISLIEIAIKLQNQAVARQQELRWWIPVVVSLVSAVVGAFAGAAIS